MKKRFLIVALALSVFVPFAAAEGLSAPAALPMVQELPAAAAGSPQLDRMGLLSLAAGILFDNNTAYISLNFPFPIQWETGASSAYVDPRWDNAWNFGWAVGADMSLFYTRWAGFHVSVDFYFPQTQSGSSGGGGSKTYAIGDYWDSACGFSFFTGPSLAIIMTERFLLAASPGVHFSVLFSDSGSYSLTRAMFGLGANVEFDVILARLFFIRAALDVTFDFIGIESASVSGAESSSGDTSNKVLNIVPSIGVGIWL